jgi:prevent-host-death family protein
MAATIQSISYVKAHLAEVIQDLNDGNRPVIITKNGAGTAVIQDHASYQRTRDALAMLKLVAMGEAEIAKGRGISQAEVFRDLHRRLARRKRGK